MYQLVQLKYKIVAPQWALVSAICLLQSHSKISRACSVCACPVWPIPKRRCLGVTCSWVRVTLETAGRGSGRSKCNGVQSYTDLPQWQTIQTPQRYVFPWFCEFFWIFWVWITHKWGLIFWPKWYRFLIEGGKTYFYTFEAFVWIYDI